MVPAFYTDIIPNDVSGLVTVTQPNEYKMWQAAKWACRKAVAPIQVSAPPTAAVGGAEGTKVLKQNHTTSTPHLTKQRKIRQLQRFYSQQQPRYRRWPIRSKSRQRNLRRSTNIISNAIVI